MKTKTFMTRDSTSFVLRIKVFVLAGKGHVKISLNNGER